MIDPKDRKGEDDWFRQHERAFLEEARRKREAREKERAGRETEDERRKLRESHWMRCPKCGHELRAEDLSDIEIDRCTYCEGVWMDAGELDELFQKKQAERQGILKRILGI